MKKVVVELLNDKAEKLLLDLAEMKIIKILPNNIEVLPKKKPSDYFGMLSKEKGAEMLKYVNESRDEWEERNI